MIDAKFRLLQTIQRLLGQVEQSPRRQRRGRMTKSYAPRERKPRKTKSSKPRKPVPKGRTELVARQKKARP